jgi:hypothetical protein
MVKGLAAVQELPVAQQRETEMGRFNRDQLLVVWDGADPLSDQVGTGVTYDDATAFVKEGGIFRDGPERRHEYFFEFADPDVVAGDSYEFAGQLYRCGVGQDVFV